MLKSRLLSATLLCFVFQSAFAAPPEYIDCVVSDHPSAKSLNDTISSCTAAIGSQKLSDSELAKAKAARAAAYKSTGHYDQALQDYKDAIDLTKVDPDLFFEAGNLYAAIRDLDHALQAYDRAIELKPSFAEALTNRCYIHNLKMESDAAISDCEKVIKLDPGVTQALNGLAIAYQDKNQCSVALIYYSKVLN
jgi:tetratricopeptide (TPR) repeat protein